MPVEDEGTKFKKIYTYIKSGDIFSERLMEIFLETREIREQDKEKIKRLIEIIESDPDYINLIIFFHNQFTFDKEKSHDVLEQMKDQKRRPASWIEFLDLLKFFTKQYGYYVTDNLLRTLRNIRQEKREK